MGNTIYSLVFCLGLILFLGGGLGCSHIPEDEMVTPVFKLLETQDSLTGGHMMMDAPVEEPKMAPTDREYLDERCSGCHKLNRVFWTRSSWATWENVLNLEDHLDIDLTTEENERLHQIFQQYLSPP